MAGQPGGDRPQAAEVRNGRAAPLGVAEQIEAPVPVLQDEAMMSEAAEIAKISNPSVRSAQCSSVMSAPHSEHMVNQPLPMSDNGPIGAAGSIDCGRRRAQGGQAPAVRRGE